MEEEKLSNSSGASHLDKIQDTSLRQMERFCHFFPRDECIALIQRQTDQEISGVLTSREIFGKLF